MKIAILTPDYYPNPYAGIGVHVFNLVSELKKQYDIEVTVIVLRCEVEGDGVPNIYEMPEEVNVIEFSGKKSDLLENEKNNYFSYRWAKNNLIAVEYLSKELNNLKFDIIHCHDLFPVWVLDLLRRKLHIPVITTVHSRFTDQLKIEDAMRGFVCRSSDRLLAVSNHLRNDLMERYGYIENSYVIYNGVEKTTIQSKPQQNRYITCCGRVTEVKGIEILIKAFHLFVLNTKDKELKLIIIGDGDGMEKYQKLCDSLRLQNLVEFVGKKSNEEARKIIRNGYIHIVPSLYESFATSALESMEEENLLIVSKVGGLKEMITNGYNGLSFKKGNEKELASKIQFIVDHPIEREQMIKNAKMDVQKFYWSNICKNTMELYLELTDEILNRKDGDNK